MHRKDGWKLPKCEARLDTSCSANESLSTPSLDAPVSPPSTAVPLVATLPLSVRRSHRLLVAARQAGYKGIIAGTRKTTPGELRNA